MIATNKTLRATEEPRFEMKRLLGNICSWAIASAHESNGVLLNKVGSLKTGSLKVGSLKVTSLAALAMVE
jgi:hypothetical protein